MIKFLYLAISSVFWIFSAVDAQAQIAAIQVGQQSWVIDAKTAEKGITLETGDGAVRLVLLPNARLTGIRVELITYASDLFIAQGEYHRVSPVYRIKIFSGDGFDGVASAGEHALDYPLYIRYPAEELGEKSVRIWNEEGSWQALGTKSHPEDSRAQVMVRNGQTDLAVFAHNARLESGLASWYNYKRCDCAASPDYPKGTFLKVTNLDNGKSVVVRINDFGPERVKHPERVVDLDVQAFKKLANKRKGLIYVKVEEVKKV